MYGMLQPVFCNALYSVLRRFVQWRFARPRYFCKVLMKNRENMEERFDFADFMRATTGRPCDMLRCMSLMTKTHVTS